MKAKDRFDIVIVGAGVIGLAIARQLAMTPALKGRSIVLLDREAGFGQLTSSRNSEVIHAGIYYPTDSLKAKLCVRGRHLLYEHCRQHDIPHRQLGKLIVASRTDSPQLEKLQDQAMKNGVDDLELIDQASLNKMEPAVAGACALFSPSSGIIDAHAYMLSLLHQAQKDGVLFSPLTGVTRIEANGDGFFVEAEVLANRTQHKPEVYAFRAGTLINSAGLDASNLARLIPTLAPELIPTTHYCKGDYFAYSGTNPFSHLVYPLPEPDTVGLGIHATLDMSGRVRFGPDTQYIGSCKYRIDPSKAAAFADSIRSYYPAIASQQLRPDYAGIRPKLAGPGEPPADFIIMNPQQSGIAGLIQLFGIESPGLTASLALAEQVRDLVLESVN